MHQGATAEKASAASDRALVEKAYGLSEGGLTKRPAREETESPARGQGKCSARDGSEAPVAA